MNIFEKFYNLKYPIVGLAPMDGITDTAFRQIVKKYGNPNIMFTEFEHVTSLIVATEKVIHTLDYSEIERPIVAQIYGKNPDHFYHISKLICALGFDGIDINMGCPARNVSNSGSGAGLIKTPDLAKEIIVSVKQGVKDWLKDQQLTGFSNQKLEFINEIILSNKQKAEIFSKKNNFMYPGRYNLINLQKKQIPVSVKTRIGYDNPITEKWISNLDTANPDWITIHGRTLKQMYAPSANWEEIAKGVKSTSKPVLANGDIKTKEDAEKILKITQAHGILIGRAALGNPWIFKEIIQNKNEEKINEQILYERNIQILIEHLNIFLKNKSKPFVEMRKHFGWYCKGFEGSRTLRETLMKTTNLEQVTDAIKNFEQNNKIYIR